MDVSVKIVIVEERVHEPHVVRGLVGLSLDRLLNGHARREAVRVNIPQINGRPGVGERAAESVRPGGRQARQERPCADGHVPTSSAG